LKASDGDTRIEAVTGSKLSHSKSNEVINQQQGDGKDEIIIYYKIHCISLSQEE
jgi:hypothetical protein